MSSDSRYVVTVSDRTTLLQGPLGAALMLGADQTGGQLSLVEHPLAPRALGSPVHTHRDEDEYSVVLEGVVGLGDSGEMCRYSPAAQNRTYEGASHCSCTASFTRDARR